MRFLWSSCVSAAPVPACYKKKERQSDFRKCLHHLRLILKHLLSSSLYLCVCTTTRREKERNENQILYERFHSSFQHTHNEIITVSRSVFAQDSVFVARWWILLQSMYNVHGGMVLRFLAVSLSLSLFWSKRAHARNVNADDANRRRGRNETNVWRVQSVWVWCHEE